MKKIVLFLFFIFFSFSQSKDVFYNIEMLSKFVPSKEYKIIQQDKKTIMYKKDLNNDYFNQLRITIDKKDKRIIDIALLKLNVFDLVSEGNKVLIRLKKKYGAFKCYPFVVPLFGRIGTECVSVNSYHGNKIYLRITYFNGNQLIVEYKNKKAFELYGELVPNKDL